MPIGSTPNPQWMKFYERAAALGAFLERGATAQHKLQASKPDPRAKPKGG